MNKLLRPSFRAPEEPDPQAEHRQGRRVFLKWAGIVMSIVLLIGAILVWGIPRVSRTLDQRALTRAEEFYRQNDFRQMLLTLEQIIQVDPRNIEARLQLVDFYEKTGSPRVLEVWRDLIALEPTSDDYRLRLALAALTLENPESARTALAQVSEKSRASTEYRRAEAGLALLIGDNVALGHALDELTKLDPNDERTKLSRALILAWAADPTKRAQGWSLLVESARGEKLRIRATLELLKLSSRENNPNAATQVAEALALKPRSGITSLIAGPPGMRDLSEYMKMQPNPEPADAARLAIWLCQRGQLHEAQLWMETLNATTQASRHVMEVKVTCAVQLKDWTRLHELLRAGAWGPVADDVWLLAMSARVQREQSALARSRETWDDAIALASNSRHNLRGLIRLSGVFSWPEETERTLWAFARRFPAERAPWAALVAGAEAEGSSEKLWQIYTEWSASTPNDPLIAAEKLLLTLVLGRENELPPASIQSLQAPPPLTSGQSTQAGAPWPSARWAARGIWFARQGDLRTAIEAVNHARTASGNSPRVTLACLIVTAEIPSERETARKLLNELTKARLLVEEHTQLQRLRIQLSNP